MSSISIDEKVAKLLTEPFENKDQPPSRYQCTDENVNEKPNFHYRGTSIGGWLVLEPWITPSLFYQFLGLTEQYGDEAMDHIAIDSFTFCKVLGAKEANRQLKIHWQHWVTEEYILSLQGINTLRVPIPDWIFETYPPYDTGCWDGALEELDRLLAIAMKANISVVLDVHAMKDSQNGLDNSGDTKHYIWVPASQHTAAAAQSSATAVKAAASPATTAYQHWSIRGGDWIGQYNTTSLHYETINQENLLHGLRVIQRIIERYKDHPAVVGLQPVNEPWNAIPWPIIQEFYWRSYQLIHLQAPSWIALLHDSFRMTPYQYWLGSSPSDRFLAGCYHYAIDSHIYHAWNWEHSDDMRIYLYRVCAQKSLFAYYEEVHQVPIVIGEWSLATDNCAMWINGLNSDVGPFYPRASCDRVACPGSSSGGSSYLPADAGIATLEEITARFQHRAATAAAAISVSNPADTTVAASSAAVPLVYDDPQGVESGSYIIDEMCPVDHTSRSFPYYTAASSQQPIEATALLTAAQLHAYDTSTHGHFFWNFRTEISARWDYKQAVDRGWLPVNYGVSIPGSSLSGNTAAEGAAAGGAAGIIGRSYESQQEYLVNHICDINAQNEIKPYYLAGASGSSSGSGSDEPRLSSSTSHPASSSSSSFTRSMEKLGLGVSIAIIFCVMIIIMGIRCLLQKATNRKQNSAYSNSKRGGLLGGRRDIQGLVFILLLMKGTFSFRSTTGLSKALKLEHTHAVQTLIKPSVWQISSMRLFSKKEEEKEGRSLEEVSSHGIDHEKKEDKFLSDLLRLMKAGKYPPKSRHKTTQVCDPVNFDFQERGEAINRAKKTFFQKTIGHKGLRDLVTIMAPSGMGKSRFLDELAQDLMKNMSEDRVLPIMITFNTNRFGGEVVPQPEVNIGARMLLSYFTRNQVILLLKRINQIT